MTFIEEYYSHLLSDGQVNPKDARVFDEEFILKTFGRIKDFLIQKGLDHNMVPTGNKLTLRQFENMFVALYRFIDQAYNPPTGNNWLEQHVPLLVEGYPHKITKSMMQTVSSKPGPVVGILDYLLNLAMAMDVDPAEAIRLLSKDECTLESETDELVRTSFKNGLSANSPEVKAKVLEVCSRHNVIMDEAEIRAERERVNTKRQEVEATLQLLEEQLIERESMEEECKELKVYLEQMNARQANKQQKLEKIEEEKAQLAEKKNQVEKLLAHTKSVVDSQPISMDEIRSIRRQTAG